MSILIDALIAGDIYLTYLLSLDAFVAICCHHLLYVSFYFLPRIQSIVQVAFVNPFINELCMFPACIWCPS